MFKSSRISDIFEDRDQDSEDEDTNLIFKGLVLKGNITDLDVENKALERHHLEEEKRKQEEGHHVKDQPNYLLVDVDYTEVQAQDLVQKPILLASQRLKLNMVALQKLKKLKLKAIQHNQVQ